MMTAKEWTDRLLYLEANRNTFYSNEYPENCGMIYEGGVQSYDCIGLVKSTINEPDIVYRTEPVGHFVKPGQVIPDKTELGILTELCTDVIWGDFSHCVNGEYLYMSGHAGVYFSGNDSVNVIECSPAWRGGVMCSWVDPDGTRKSWRYGDALGKWEAHGKLSQYIDYSDTANGLQYINGEWIYLKNGRIDTSFNGLAQNQFGWWKCKNGKVDFNFSGLAKHGSDWFYCKNGAIDWSFNGLCQLGKSWWLVKNGKVDMTFTGLWQNYDKSWWYIIKGQIDFTYTGLVQNGKDYWKVVKNKVDSDYFGLGQNERGAWMYFEAGKFIPDHFGLVPNASGTWVVQKGLVDFDFNGEYHYSGADYKVKKGCVIK